MSFMSSNKGASAELYVRSLAPRGARDQQERVVAALDRLTDRETFADYTITVCGEYIPAGETETSPEFETQLRNRIADFETWATTNGWSLGPLFERKVVGSLVTDDTHEVLVVPLMVLAEYEGDRLRFVTPCETDERYWTVQDRLDALARSGPTTTRTLSDTLDDSPATSTPTS
jgi:hypothetical protein